MKKLFTAIRKGDKDTVKQLLDKRPELVNCVAKQPPKKDDGQSPLQVALKTGQFDIVDLLIDRGANLNFMEDEATCCNEWRQPVVQDAVMSAVMHCRWSMESPYYKDKKGNPRIEIHSTKEKADRTYYILKRMLEMGADINALDSFGRNGLWRFCIQASNIVPSYNYAKDHDNHDKIYSKDVEKDLKRILVLLKDSGVDQNQISKDMGGSPMYFYAKGTMHRLLCDVFNLSNDKSRFVELTHKLKFFLQKYLYYVKEE